MLGTGKTVFSWVKGMKEEEQGDHGRRGDWQDMAGEVQRQSRLLQSEAALVRAAEEGAYTKGIIK